MESLSEKYIYFFCKSLNALTSSEEVFDTFIKESLNKEFVFKYKLEYKQNNNYNKTNDRHLHEYYINGELYTDYEKYFDNIENLYQLENIKNKIERIYENN